MCAKVESRFASFLGLYGVRRLRRALCVCKLTYPMTISKQIFAAQLSGHNQKEEVKLMISPALLFLSHNLHLSGGHASLPSAPLESIFVYFVGPRFRHGLSTGSNRTFPDLSGHFPSADRFLIALSRRLQACLISQWKTLGGREHGTIFV